MKWIKVAIIALILQSLAACLRPGVPDDISRLELIKVLPVVSDFPVEPSGLTYHKGILYAVCDKTDYWVFRLDIQDQHVRFVPHLRFEPPRGGPMDFEGIAVDSENNFLLASEYHHRVLKVTPSGKAQWITPNLKTYAEPEGLLKRFNAGLEGIAILDDGSLLLAAEREDRGLIKVPTASSGDAIQVFPIPGTRFRSALPFWRMPDFSGLARDGENLYGLFRNAHLLVELRLSEEGADEGDRAWSYGFIENDPQYAYIEERFGQAEGLAVSGDMVYLIFDNNQGPRLKDHNDHRPQLIIARIPAEDKD